MKESSHVCEQQFPLPHPIVSFMHIHLLSSRHGCSTSRLDTRIPSRKTLRRVPTNGKEVVGFNTSANGLYGHHEGVWMVFGECLFALHLLMIHIHVWKFVLRLQFYGWHINKNQVRKQMKQGSSLFTNMSPMVYDSLSCKLDMVKTNNPPTLTSACHQWTVSTSTGYIQWLSPVKPTLKKWPLLVGTVHWWPIPISVGGLYVNLFWQRKMLLINCV